jgi:hypothetical protein
MKLKKSLDDLLGTKVYVYLAKSVKPFIDDIYLADNKDNDPSDPLMISGLLVDVDKSGIFLHQFSEGQVAWAQAVQEMEEGKMTVEFYAENHIQPIFFPWRSIVSIIS